MGMTVGEDKPRANPQTSITTGFLRRSARLMEESGEKLPTSSEENIPNHPQPLALVPGPCSWPLFLALALSLALSLALTLVPDPSPRT